MKIGNAFSPNMVQLPATIVCSKISVEQIKSDIIGECTLVGVHPDGKMPEECHEADGWCKKCKNCIPKGASALESVIGHADTAAIVARILGVDLQANRANVKLQKGEKMIVAQYSGPRLPEGATQLPDGAKIEFVLVEVN